LVFQETNILDADEFRRIETWHNAITPRSAPQNFRRSIKAIVAHRLREEKASAAWRRRLSGHAALAASENPPLLCRGRF
jgi:beta-lactamase class D